VKNKSYLLKLGMAFPKGSPHVSRTMMLAELGLLLEYVTNPNASRDNYIRAIVEDNCLGKRTEKNRQISKRYLLELYSLDRETLLFRALLFFWQRDAQGRPLLALLCAYARDTLLRASAKYILPLAEGALVTRENTEEFLEQLAPGRYSPGKLASNAKNLNSTWTQSGHLAGRVRKIRSRVTPTAGSVAYALLLAHVAGGRGPALLQSEYLKALDCPPDRAVELAEEASRRGWLVWKRVGDVIEVCFPGLINEQEMEWLREQS
jgi:hypothetical protein